MRDEARILGIVTGYLSGGTAFPLHVLRDTYEARLPSEPPAHVLVVSDDGVDTMFQEDERGTPGASIAREALRPAPGLSRAPPPWIRMPVGARASARSRHARATRMAHRS